MLKENSPKLQIIDEINNRIRENVPQDIADLICKFVNRFLSTVSYDDLVEHKLSDLYGAILCFWNYIYKRKSEEIKIRIYNPDFEKFGWESKHTIVEILHDDMPFLVDSIMMAINNMGIYSQLIIHSGDMKFIRDKEHKIIDILDFSEKENGKKTFEEVPIFIEVNRQTDQEKIDKLKDKILRTIHDVSLAVEDWQLMQKQIKSSINELKEFSDKLDHDEIDESVDFLEWLVDNNFTILGIKNYRFTQSNDKSVSSIADTGLGILRQSSNEIGLDVLQDLPEAGKKLMLSKQPLVISKTSTISNIHRPTYNDYVGIKIFNKNGKVIGQKKIVGLFASIVYSSNPKNIPLIRNKMKKIFIKSERKPDSHAGRVLRNILDNLPRDDLFQASVDELLSLAKGISYIQERKKIKFFARFDPCGKFISCFVFVPRENFNTDLRRKFQNILNDYFNAEDIQYSTYFSDSVLARINFIIRVSECENLEIDIKEIENKLIEVSKIWTDSFYVCLLEHFGEERGNNLYNIYRNAFPLSYQEEHSYIEAVYDVALMDDLSSEKSFELKLYKAVDDLSGMIKLKIFNLNNNIPLSDVVPILENMGLKVIYEQPHELVRSDGSTIWLSDFGLIKERGSEVNLLETKEIFQECFHYIWCNECENDKFNSLILDPVLNWREISILRAYSKYLQQIRFTFSQQYIEAVLLSHPKTIDKIIELFHIRFDPSISRNIDKEQDLYRSIIIALDKVTNLDEDRILRRYLELIMATIRTNFYQLTADQKHKKWVSFKIDSIKLPELPLPYPMYEIFVYSPRFEGIHLRSFKVARGGIRWSDRKEDFRTEILGLMKAQVVKNAVIVPSGAKGGFVPKKLPTDGSREEIFAEGLECYKCFISGLLDVTDNMIENKVIPPDNTVRYDKDDPYFVVAADKGTATFSDIANQISSEYKFWLGDAFASGGAVGYDHKKMGITARGAWESVKRHFRSLDIDTQTTSFTVVGIGDMAGDVFGNGMLLSKKIKLIVAFNHLHIFIDPSPDPEKSYHERQRLFNHPETSWLDYDKKLISEGGGVYSRKAKSVVLSKEAKNILDIQDDQLSPNELIKKILCAPVDLLWNGGIGTYVKSSKETDLAVGDKNNDNTRVNANELRCKVVGEGGNLGFTQLARIEYNFAGGLIYTDFIDNSAGVDCSDHEVNIKILLNEVVSKGDMTIKQRNKLLKSMTVEVASLVLSHNYKQTGALSLIWQHAYINLDLHIKYIDELENDKKINRNVEYLPSTEILKERKQEGKGLTMPGIAIIFAYTKNLLSEDILHSDLPEDDFCLKTLLDFFPTPIKKDYQSYVYQHRLKREIISTKLSNNMIDEVGFTFVHRLKSETGANSAEIVKAYLVAKEIFECDKVREQISRLDNIIIPRIQNDMFMQLIRLMRRATRWILRNHRGKFQITKLIKMYQARAQEAIVLLVGSLKGYDLQQYKKKLAEYKKINLPEEMASYFSMSRALHATLDCVDAAIKFNLPIKSVIDVYFELGNTIGLSWLRSKIISSSVENSWDALSREALRDDIDWQQKRLVVAILSNSKGNKLSVNIKIWEKEYSSLINRWEQILHDIKEHPSTSFTVFFVATRELLDLTQASSKSLPELSIIK